MSFFPIITRRTSYTGAQGIYTYRRYKVEIAEDCVHRCVYCDCHCNSLGGQNAMELDHFKPKADMHFPELANDPTNLVLACRSCNGKKRDDWPVGRLENITHAAGIGYVDPFTSERTLYFEVKNCGNLSAKEAPAAYMIEQLSLNRPFATAIRCRRILRLKLHTAIDTLANELRKIDGSTDQTNQLCQIADLLIEANQALRDLEMEDGPVL